MADGDTDAPKFTGAAHTHVGATAETVLTIPTETDHHYALLVVIHCQDPSSTRHHSFSFLVAVQNNAGTMEVNATSIGTVDQSGATYTASVTDSGTNVVVQVAAEADAMSSAIATGTAFELDVSIA